MNKKSYYGYTTLGTKIAQILFEKGYEIIIVDFEREILKSKN